MPDNTVKLPYRATCKVTKGHHKWGHERSAGRGGTSVTCSVCYYCPSFGSALHNVDQLWDAVDKLKEENVALTEFVTLAGWLSALGVLDVVEGDSPDVQEAKTKLLETIDRQGAKRPRKPA